MKIKHLLPVFIGLAMASCSQDDDFGGQIRKGEYSPITFSVTKEGDADTKIWNADEQGRWNSFSFQMGDLLSLWNGMGWNETNSDWTSIGQNAVFEGETSNGALIFKTHSLVNPGTAILVYPADTTFANKTDLTISVPSEQDATTRQFLPYVSDVMTIGDYDEYIDHNNTAGYGRQYDVVLHMAASLFGVKLEPTESIDFNALGVDEIEFTGVTIANGTILTFPTKANVTVGDDSSNLTDADAEKYAHFTSESVIEPSSDDVATSISTTDIDATTKYAYFTLLPQSSSSTLNLSGASIVVNTTYGTVTVSNDASAAVDAVGPLQTILKDAGTNLAENLENVLNSVWKSTAGSVFGDKSQGRRILRTLSLDLSTLDMNNTVVTTSTQLINLLKVYNALKIAEKQTSTTLILNGKETTGEFALTGDAVAALKLYNAAGKIKLDVATNDQKILLADAGATVDKLADASVKFVNKSGNAEQVEVILAAGVDWTLDQAYNGSKETAQSVAKVTKVISRGNLTYTNTTGSTVVPTYDLEIESGTMAFNASKTVLGTFKTGVDSKITVASGKTVTFGARADLYGEIENNGILSAAAMVVQRGYVDNKFEMSVLQGVTGASIVNIGEIFNDGVNAVTYITQNGASTGNIGRIVLTTENDNVSIKNTTSYAGYIVYTKEVADGARIDMSGKIYNWLIVDAESNVGVTNVTLNGNIKYLQVKGETVNVTTPTSGIQVTGLFVNGAMRLLSTNAISATNIYVSDYILHSGLLSGTQQKSYTSRVVGEPVDNKTYANGEIRTVSAN